MVIHFADRYEVVRYIDGDPRNRVVVDEFPRSEHGHIQAHRLDAKESTTARARSIWNEQQKGK